MHERIHDMKEILTANLMQEKNKIVIPKIQAGLAMLTIALGLTGSITGLFFSMGKLLSLVLSGLAITFTVSGIILVAVYMHLVDEFTERETKFTKLTDQTLKNIDLMQNFAIDQYVILHSLTSYTESISAEWTIIIMAIYGLEEDVLKYAHDRNQLHPFLIIVLGRIISPNQRPINPDYKQMYLARLIDIACFQPIKNMGVIPRVFPNNTRTVTLSEAYIIACLYQRVLSIFVPDYRAKQIIEAVLAENRYTLIIPSRRNTNDGNAMFKAAGEVIIALRTDHQGIPSFDPLTALKSIGFNAMCDIDIRETHGAGANTRKAKTVAELRDYARRRKINLHGATKKADIIAIIHKKK